MTQRTLDTDNLEQTAMLFGSFDCHALQIEKAYGVSIRSKDDETVGGSCVVVSGNDEDAVDCAYRVLKYLRRAAQINHEITEQNVRRFQNASLLPDTGRVDLETWNRILRDYKNYAQ